MKSNVSIACVERLKSINAVEGTATSADPSPPLLLLLNVLLVLLLLLVPLLLVLLLLLSNAHHVPVGDTKVGSFRGSATPGHRCMS